MNPDLPTRRRAAAARRAAPFALLLLAVLGACAEARPTGPAGGPSEVIPERPASVALERAVQDVDVGTDLEHARRDLEALLDGGGLAPDERDDATLALARARDGLGERDAAVELVERLLAAHPVERSFPAEAAAERLLRRLLTGAEEPVRAAPDAPIARIARHLAKFADETAPNRFEASVLQIGGDRATSFQLGTFNFEGALREERETRCPLCDERLGFAMHASTVTDWVAIPRLRPQLATSFVFLYVDRQTGGIPARYADVLPVPLATLEAHLDRGEGLVAVRQREGAPPVVLLAAPRRVQLRAVEAAFADLPELPAEPRIVALDRGLQPSEIKATVRAARPALGRCYEALLAKAGKVSAGAELRFTVDAEGKTTRPAVKVTGVADADFDACLTAVVVGLPFPATGEAKDVTYPFAFTP